MRELVLSVCCNAHEDGSHRHKRLSARSGGSSTTIMGCFRCAKHRCQVLVSTSTPTPTAPCKSELSASKALAFNSLCTFAREQNGFILIYFALILNLALTGRSRIRQQPTAAATALVAATTSVGSAFYLRKTQNCAKSNRLLALVHIQKPLCR